MKSTENASSSGVSTTRTKRRKRKRIDLAIPVLGRGPDELPGLLKAPTLPTPANDAHDSLPSAPTSDNQPLLLPNREQTSPSQDELGLHNRFARLNPDMKAFVEFHGGTPLKNKELVLARVEKWDEEHRDKLIRVERNNEKKGGIVRVICGMCGKKDSTIQKAAEHITSEHWRLSIWECDECPKSYRRRQELVDHKKKHKGKKPVLTDSTLPSPAKPIPGPSSIDLSRLQARSVRPCNGNYPPTGGATTSSAPSLAPSASSQGGKSITQHSSTRGQEPYPNHEQTAHLRHERFDPNSIGAQLPSVPPSIPLEHPLLPEMSSSYHPAYGALPRQVLRETIGGYSRDYYHSSVLAIAPATESHLTASVNKGNFGGNTMHATIPQPQAQHSASHYPVPRPMISHFQQTQRNMEYQRPLLQYSGPMSYDPRQWSYTSNMPPPLDVGYTYR